ncbi:MAG: insulinase family protein [Lachnospiraceae bacterium]|nr:insulinase family protein [Lachnospiraceae bacterium]
MDFERIKDLYELLEERDIPDLHSKGYRLKHKKSGARFMLLENDDRNKVFYIGFRTPPMDSTGAPHILEHSVLCGSDKFPVKDPFIELAKGSLNTFLNAMTYPDKTVYPVASTNKQDFRNLIDVYMDAVLHPNIYKKEEIFKQEGWHYEINSPEEPLKFNGVVYNEMKGAYSSPDDVLGHAINTSLFPDTRYALDSGGDPEHIPDLSYERFKELHEKYYHPSNSYIYLYGDLDMADTLSFLDEEYLCHYERAEIDSALNKQPPFNTQQYLEKSYSITEDEDEKENTYISENFVIGDNLNPETYIAFQILSYALLDVPGAPLTQTLLDRGIGQDVDGGYDNGILQPVFSITVKKSDLDKKQVFLDTVSEVLNTQVEKGLDKKALLAAINVFEFRYREADFGSYPKGLMYGLQSLDSWLYDEDKPFIHIESNAVFEKLRKEVEKGYFEELIKKYLIDNSFSSVVILKPEKGLTAKMEERTAARLQKIKDGLSDQEIEALIRDTAALKQYQDEPSSEEELLTIPLLKISDLEKKAEGFDNELLSDNGIDYLFHDIYTNGISYLNFSFSLNKLPEELIPYASLFTALLGQLNTKNHSYLDLNNEINLHSGGITFGVSASQRVDKRNVPRCFIEVQGRFLKGSEDFAFEIIPEILETSDLSDRKRISEVLSMMKSRISDKLISAGHLTAAVRAAASLSASADFLEKTSGVFFYDFICEQIENMDKNFDELSDRLSQVRKLILRKDMLSFDITGDRESLEKVKSLGGKYALTLDASPADDIKCTFSIDKKCEGIRTASQVQYVAEAGDYTLSGLKYTGALRVLKVIMGYDYLWMNVRVKGGAYGCMSSFSRYGDSYLVSYRDPNLTETLDIFNGAAEYVKNFDAGERDMTKYVIGAVSALDHPLNPRAKGIRSRSAYLSGLTEEDMQRERDEVINCSVSDIKALYPFMEAIKDSGYVCVLGSEEKIKENKSIFSEVRTLN